MNAFDETSLFIIKFIDESFVNREDELKAIEHTFERISPLRIVNISGEGGSGKTWLMYKAMMELAAKSRFHIASSAIDFYLTEFHSQGGIRKGIVKRLGEQYFPKFNSLIKDIQRLRELSGGSESVAITSLENTAAEMFIEEYKTLTNARNVVLAFDTFELIQEQALARWFLFELLPKLEGTCVILSGRGNHKLNFHHLTEHVTSVPIGRFDKKDVLALFQRREVPQIKDELLTKIVELMQGRPLLVELAIDWLKEDFDFEKILTSKNFEANLVAAIRELRKPEYLAILHLAWAYRRCNMAMLKELMADDKIDYEGLVKTLSRLSFVKYRKSIDSILLHDIMRELVVKYVWAIIDPTAAERIALSRRILSYYQKTLLRDAQSEYEKSILTAEMVFYSAYTDLGQSYEHFAKVFDKLANSLRYDDCELLLWEISEISRSVAALAPQRQKEVDIRHARMMVFRNQFSEALEFIERFIEHESDPKFKLQMHLVRADCYDRTGEILNALKDREMAVKLAGDDSVSRDDKGKAHSELGYSYRIVGRWDDAIRSLQTALKHLEKSTELGEIANIYNTIGYIYALKTDYETALQYCQVGLKYRQQIGHRKGEAWSRSTLGEIWRYKGNYSMALKFLDEALRIFTEGQDKEQQARVYQQRGICYVEMGEIEKAKKDFALAFAYYKMYPAHREYPRALSRYARIFQYQGDHEEARRQFEYALEFAHKIADVDTEVYTLFRLAQISYVQGQPIERIYAYRDRIEEIMKSTTYQNLQHQGQVNIVIGHKHFAEKRYNEALGYYAKGILFIATQHAGAYLISDYLNEIAEQMDKLDSHERVKWCDFLFKSWKAKGIFNRHPELSTFCEIGRQTASLALQQEKTNASSEKPTNRHPS